jgi:hypothetical protein
VASVKSTPLAADGSKGQGSRSTYALSEHCAGGIEYAK